MRTVFFTCLFLHFLITSRAELPKSKSYDLKSQRLLIQISGLFNFTAAQGRIDLDSAMLLACENHNLSFLESFDEDFAKQNTSPAFIALKSGDLISTKSYLGKIDIRDRINLSLGIGAYYLSRVGSKQNDLKNALKFFYYAYRQSRHLKAPDLKYRALSMLGRYYVQSGNQLKSSLCFLNVINSALVSKNKLSIADAYGAYGSFLPYGNPDKLAYLQKSFNEYLAVGSKEKQIEILCKMVSIDFLQNNRELALSRLNRMLQLQKEIRFKHSYYTESVIAWIENTRSNYNRALYYALLSLKNLEAVGDSSFAGTAYLRLADIYHQTNRLDEATVSYKKAMKSFENGYMQPSWYKTFSNYVYTITASERPLEALALIKESIKHIPPILPSDKMEIAINRAFAYLHLRRSELVRKYSNEAAYWASKVQSEEQQQDVLYSYALIANFFARINDFIEAKKYLEKSSLLPIEKYNYLATKLIFHTKYKIDSANGNLAASLDSFKQFKIAEDSAINAQKNRQILEIEMRFQTAKKENDIKLLQNEKLLQENRLKQEVQAKNITFVGSSLLLIIVGLLYSRFRIKQKTNEMLISQKEEISEKNNSLEELLLEKDHILEEKESLIEEKQELIVEKEWLIKEIHHRVKNNLQIVMSLLNSQSAFIGNDVALNAIKESQYRVQAISLIHQKLYQSENVALILMKDYIPELINYLKESFNIRKTIRFKMDIGLIHLDVSQAVPVGLILNEAITNSIKYAFLETASGIISIILDRPEPHKYRLIISDTGPGLAEGYDLSNLTSLGMKLIAGLSRQLGGTLSIESVHGLSITVIFSEINIAISKSAWDRISNMSA
ncbi:histidine kinase dimerization/phosphoacceptor domain -containing protein [Dyadobacter subterraneus]|uniref:histidine kinase n=1 Tax=Dyadobacter subterraneus TaxID=2773304 RepID=A0ABR9W8N5_9BACT|nr:histidine kinase dimerization/phosphoacceptor domain -containing protein [Dyadobacter subterraneus]MBE9461296.1 hypothetical protein [Dyadobacter subterraneus]